MSGSMAQTSTHAVLGVDWISWQVHMSIVLIEKSLYCDVERDQAIHQSSMGWNKTRNHTE